MPQRAKGLHVELAACVIPVKAARHEVAASAFVMQPALGHGDSCVAGHQVIGVLDLSVTAWIREFPVAVVGDAIKLENPVLESCGSIHLS